MDRYQKHERLCRLYKASRRGHRASATIWEKLKSQTLRNLKFERRERRAQLRLAV